MTREFESYLTIYRESMVEEEIKKSQFIGRAFPVKSEEDIEEIMDGIRTEYRDATHNCSAYILGIDRNVQRFFDDGEPSGTAGIPILEVMKKDGVTDVLIVVTRYFGGIKLGAGGLIRAYGGVAKQALDAAVVVENKNFTEIAVTYDYTHHGKIENFLNEADLIIDDMEFLDKVTVTVAVDEVDSDAFMNRLMDLTAGDVQCKIVGRRYVATKDGQII